MTLDYRMPDTGEHRVLKVMAELQQEEAIDWIMAVVKLLIGVPLTLVIPFVISIYLSGWRSSGVFLSTFFWVSVVAVPILLWLERRERQDYLWEATSEPFWMFVVDFALLGPRMLLSLYEQMHHEAEAEETIALAAMLTIELLDLDQAVEVRLLMTGDRSAPELRRALRYLQHRRWVIIGRCRSRVWLSTSVRNQLAHLK